MLLTMADASLSQHIDTGLGAVSTCRTEIYGPKVYMLTLLTGVQPGAVKVMQILAVRHMMLATENVFWVPANCACGMQVTSR